jgi:hypothetical protein
MEESDDNDSQPIKRKIRKNDDEGVERKKIKNLATSDDSDSEEVDDEEGEQSPQKMKPSRRFFPYLYYTIIGCPIIYADVNFI